MSLAILTCLWVGSTIYYIVIAKTFPLKYFSYWILVVTTFHYTLLVAAQIRVRFNYPVVDGPSPLYLWKWANISSTFTTLGILIVCYVWWAQESTIALSVRI